ncbi:MAG TPA: ATPase, partial [Aliiroseovarius sp.]|nr:ATPase [Aliiroseovarius sp.]
MAGTFSPAQEASVRDSHALPAAAVLDALASSAHGLSRDEAAARLQSFGRNSLPRPAPPGIVRVFLRQFTSPLIYVLLAAALLSLLIREYADAVFIFTVLLLNALIGSAQEYSAQRAA